MCKCGQCELYMPIKGTDLGYCMEDSCVTMSCIEDVLCTVESECNREDSFEPTYEYTKELMYQEQEQQRIAALNRIPEI